MSDFWMETRRKDDDTVEVRRQINGDLRVAPVESVTVKKLDPPKRATVSTAVEEDV